MSHKILMMGAACAATLALLASGCSSTDERSETQEQPGTVQTSPTTEDEGWPGQYPGDDGSAAGQYPGEQDTGTDEPNADEPGTVHDDERLPPGTADPVRDREGEDPVMRGETDEQAGYEGAEAPVGFGSMGMGGDSDAREDSTDEEEEHRRRRSE